MGTTPPCNEEDKALFAAATTVSIGDGSTALFWHSSWIGPNTLASAYPVLLSHSKCKNRTVRDALRDDTWIEDLRHGDTQPLLQKFVQLNRLIIAAAPELREGERDTIRWNHEATGKYTSSSAYAMQFQGWILSDLDELIWKAWAPGNIKFFAWLLLQDHLWTNDCLQRRGWPKNYFCQLCVRNLESAHHLLWNCQTTIEVWGMVGAREGCRQLAPHHSWQKSTSPAIMHRMISKTPPAQRKGANTIMLLTCWEIWKERNSCTFRGKQPAARDIAKAIENSVELWRQAGATCLERPFWDPP